MIEHAENLNMSDWPSELKYAPILVFPYTRYDKLQKTISALQNNTLAAESVLFLFSDAAFVPEHEADVKRVREYLHTISGFKRVIIIEREKNLGSLGNIFDAMPRIMDKYERYILLEDDIVTSPYFLQYMNDALVYYKDDPRIMAISAYRAPFKCKIPNGVFYLQYFQPWGYAMWKNWRERACALDAENVMKELKRKSLLKKFNYYSSFIISNQRMLQRTMGQKININDVLFSANILNQDGYVVYPSVSMSNNIGLGDGVHCTVQTNDYDAELADHPVDVKSDLVQENKVIVKSYHRWFLKVHFKLLIKYFATLAFLKKIF